LQSEAGYYLTHLQGAIHFIESLDHTSLSINKAEFDAAIEARMAAIDEEEAEARARAVLATLDSSSSSGLAPATSAGAVSAPSSAPLLSNPRLEQIAATAKKPIELLSRWWQDTVAPSPPPAAATTAPTDHAASFARHAQDSAAARAPATAADPVRAHHELVAVPSPTGGTRIAAAASADEEEDYELQLAMAMSASLEEDRRKWEAVPDELLAEGGAAAGGSAASASASPMGTRPSSAPQEDDLAGFSLQASAAAAAAIVLPSGADAMAPTGHDPGTAGAQPVGDGSAPVEGADAATAGGGYQLLI
ncbi:hypothetical protein GGF32_007759, partial [Allomyces javanicus]